MLRNSSSNTLREVGLGVGSNEIDGAIEIVGAADGATDMLGSEVGPVDGWAEIDGSTLGSDDREGTLVG